MRAQPEQPFEHLGATGAHEPGEAEDLARRDLEAHVARPTRHGQAGHGEQRRRDRARVLGRVEVAQFAADHEVGHLLARHVACALARHEPAVAHHHDLVGDAFDLVELVRDVDHGDAVRLQLGDQHEQALRLPGRQRRGGFVHDQHAGVALQRLRDLDQLLLRDDQLAHRRVRPSREADLPENTHRLGPHRLVVQPSAARLLVAEKDVLRDRQVFGQRELLVDQHDAACLGRARAVEMHRRAADTQLARARRLVAGQDLDHRALAGAVLADQTDDASWRQIQAHTVQHLHRAEGLGHAVERDGERDAGHAVEGRSLPIGGSRDVHDATGLRTAVNSPAAALPRPRRVSCNASTPAPIRPPWSPSGV